MHSNETTKVFQFIIYLLLIPLIVYGCGGSSGGGSDDGNGPPPSITGIQVTPASAEVPINTGGVMRATAYFSDGSFLDVTLDSIWTSSDESVAVVDSITGYAYALSAGTAILEATYEGESDTSDITVNTATLEQIEVIPDNESTGKNVAVEYTAIGYFDDDSEQDITPFVTWNSSDTTVATILSNGFATTVGEGTTTIEATLNGISESTILEVTGATLSFIELLPESVEIEVLGSLSMYVRAYYSDDSYRTVTSQSILTSSNDQVARFVYPGTGLIKGITPGTVNITATYEDESATSVITVISATLEDIVVSPSWTQVPAGRTVQYKATGYYSNGHHNDVTNFATWQCVDRTATIESGWNEELGWVGGLATAVIPGHFALIEAYYEGVTGYAEMRVLP